LGVILNSPLTFCLENMLKSMNRYVWVAVCTVAMFFFAPRRSQDPLGAAVIAVASGLVVLLVVLAIDFIVKPLRARAERAKFPALLLAAADGDLAQVESILKSGAPVDQTGPNGETALMLAARNGKLEVARRLLDAGANPSIQTPKGSTAAALAERFNHPELHHLLSRRNT